MKLQFVALLMLLCLMAAVPAMAQYSQPVYDNGPVNGEAYAWVINFGYAVSNSFQLTNSPFGQAVNGIQFWGWLIPDDIATSVEVQIGASPFGNELSDQIVNLTQSDCFLNSSYGLDVCLESGNFSRVTLSNGNYWLTLSNANDNQIQAVYWDENSGVGCQSNGCPSQAQDNFPYGTIPSEAFTLLGATGCSWCAITPEPSSLVLFGSGILSLAAMLGLKIRR
ncbi:MAG: PEP-CTERM sorting domain-containing protein [Candidatus Korobacteraceae bacterium]